MADCHKIAGDNKSNYAIPRIKALPYKGDGGVNCACVKAAMARWNQVKGATAEEKARAKALLIRVAKSKCKMDVEWESFWKQIEEEFDVEITSAWTPLELVKQHKDSHEKGDMMAHHEATICLTEGYGMMVYQINVNSWLDTM